jgi:hypothetical protein
MDELHRFVSTNDLQSRYDNISKRRWCGRDAIKSLPGTALSLPTVSVTKDAMLKLKCKTTNCFCISMMGLKRFLSKTKSDL